MMWKKTSNIIIVYIFSIAYTVVTVLNIIAPLHMNNVGNINKLGIFSVYSIIYWLMALLLTWSAYFYLQKKPEVQFFTLIVVGIMLIIIENFLGAWIG